LEIYRAYTLENRGDFAAAFATCGAAALQTFFGEFK
jgi:hypothetical protein